MHPVFIELYQQYKKITNTRMYSMFPAEMDNLFIENKSLFEAWLPGSDQDKAQLPLKTAFLILAVANKSAFRWWCTTYNASVETADKVLFLDDPYVKIWMSILDVSTNRPILTDLELDLDLDLRTYRLILSEQEYNHVARINSENINSLLAAVTRLINDDMWRLSTKDVLFSSESMSPSLWDKQVNAMIALSKFNYVTPTSVFSRSFKAYNEDWFRMHYRKDLFLPYIKQYLSDDRSWESFVKMLKMIDDSLQLSIDKDTGGPHGSLQCLRNSYYDTYDDDGDRTKLYSALIKIVMPNILGNLDEMILAWDTLVTEKVDAFRIMSRYDYSNFSETFSILSVAPYNYRLNAYAYQHLHGRLSKENIITIIRHSERFGSQLIDALRRILDTHPDIFSGYNFYIPDIVFSVIQYENPSTCAIASNVNIFCDGMIEIKIYVPQAIRQWINLSPKKREIILPYIQQFANHQLLTQDLFSKLIAFSTLIESLPESCSLQYIPESLITKASLEKVQDFFLTMDSTTPGCSIILQDYLQEISESKEVVIKRYFKDEETSTYEYRALKMFSADNPFPTPTESATDEIEDEIEAGLDC